jgi:hypothetical protein
MQASRTEESKLGGIGRSFLHLSVSLRDRAFLPHAAHPCPLAKTSANTIEKGTNDLASHSLPFIAELPHAVAF